MDKIKQLEGELNEFKSHPDFKAGDTISVAYKIIEGSKERIQQFQGVVLQRRNSGASETFTVRKISGGIGVERIIPLQSPFIESIKVVRTGTVRRARIFYQRELTGKAARIKEKRMKLSKED
jgi:large subunit ribosomal protein L19